MNIICIVAHVVDPHNVIERKMRIEKCAPVQTNVRWPAPVDQRLNELLDRLAEAGSDATRSQLLAALVAQAPTSGTDLANLLAEYKRTTAGELVLQPRGQIVIPRRRPGRRGR
jgi:hypothetical protein